MITAQDIQDSLLQTFYWNQIDWNCNGKEHSTHQTFGMQYKKIDGVKANLVIFYQKKFYSLIYKNYFQTFEEFSCPFYFTGDILNFLHNQNQNRSIIGTKYIYATSKWLWPHNK